MGRPGKARAEPRQEADGLSHMAVQISPVNFTSQFYILPLHMSTTEATPYYKWVEVIDLFIDKHLMIPTMCQEFSVRLNIRWLGRLPW